MTPAWGCLCVMGVAEGRLHVLYCESWVGGEKISQIRIMGQMRDDSFHGYSGSFDERLPHHDIRILDDAVRVDCPFGCHHESPPFEWSLYTCLLYTSDAADDLTRVDLGGRRIIKKKKKK